MEKSTLNKILRVTKISKTFDTEKAVTSCSFDVEKGKITALIGPNGAGKSTVFNLISGIISPTSGQIYFKDQQIIKLSVEERANLGISRMFQKAQLFKNLTVADNLHLALVEQPISFWSGLFRSGKPNDDELATIKQVLTNFKIEKLLNSLTDTLSYGQKRLVELARSLLKNHQLLMLDEPVSGVSPQIKQEISQILSNLKKQGETILIIEHDMNFILSIADHVIVMDDGLIITQGNPKQIENNPKVLDAYLGE